MAPVAATAARGAVSRYFTKEGTKKALTVAATKSGKLSKAAGEGTSGNPGGGGAGGIGGALKLAGSGKFTGLKVEYVIAALLVLFVPVADRSAVSTRTRFGNWVRQLLAITLLYAVLIMVAAIGPRSKRLMTLVGFLFLLGIALSNRFGAGTAVLPRIFDAIVRILTPTGGEAPGVSGAAGGGRGAFSAFPAGAAGGGGGGGAPPGSSANSPNDQARGGGPNASGTGASGRQRAGRRGNPQEAPGIPSLRRRGSSDLNNSPLRLPTIKPPPDTPQVAPPPDAWWLNPGKSKPPWVKGPWTWDDFINSFRRPPAKKPPTRRHNVPNPVGGGVLPDIDKIPPVTRPRGRVAPSVRSSRRAPIPRFSDARARRWSNVR